jgi:hypothetical protein
MGQTAELVPKDKNWVNWNLNGRRMISLRGMNYTYNDICVMEEIDPLTRPTITVAYPPSSGMRDIELKPAQVCVVVQGTVINCYHTNNA